jgi:hypothetical protein
MRFSNIISLNQSIFACKNMNLKAVIRKPFQAGWLVFMSVYYPVSYRNILKKNRKISHYIRSRYHRNIVCYGKYL